MPSPVSITVMIVGHHSLLKPWKVFRYSTETEDGAIQSVAPCVDVGLALDSYYLFHAIRADLLRRVSRHRNAIDAHDEELSRCTNLTERRSLQQRREVLIRECSQNGH